MNRHQNLPARRRESGIDSFTDLFEQYAKDFFSPALANESGEFNPKIDVRETIKTYIVTAEIPGIKEEDVSITLRDNNLILEGEKRFESKKEEKNYYRSEIEYGNFYRTIPLNADVDDKNVEAYYKNGVLTVTLIKKSDGKDKMIKIPIKH